MAQGQSMSLFMNQLEASSSLMNKLFLCLYNYYAAHKQPPWNSTVINCVTASTMYCSVSFADVILLQLKIAHEEPVSGKTD